MNRDTVDFGIDLGTTNSAIAVAGDRGVKVFRNIHQMEFTPSAVYVHDNGTVQVGQVARERTVHDPGNAIAEFKLHMGRRDRDKTFETTGRTVSPEELSAEVLKSLRADVERATGEIPPTAVITVPAAFTADQTAATRVAAELAGLQSAPLLQEPTAAAWAFAAEGRVPERGFWLVYDFGGGTFDAAVIRFEDDEFTVVNHAGDNTLGGKRIDWALVEDYLLPALRDQHGVTGVHRDNPETRSILAKLKQIAEAAKIQLAQIDVVDAVTDIKIDGHTVDLAYRLTRDQVDAVARPLVASSVRLCRQALAEARIPASEIERVLMVGGTSQLPLIHRMLADPDEGLGIRLDQSLDPVTVVARGAAIYAATQRFKHKTEPTAGQVGLDLDYEPSGIDIDPLVGGRASSPEVTDWSGWTIELRNTTAIPEWTSGSLGLRPDGTFSTRLHADPAVEGRNRYEITVRDAVGSRIECDPNTLTYQVGLEGPKPTLSHTLSVGLRDGSVAPLAAKNTALPKTGQVTGLRTTASLDKATGQGLISIPILSGEHPRAERNTVVGKLDIRPNQVSRDVPEGTEIEVSVGIDTNQQIMADCYVPFLDAEFTIETDMYRPILPTVEELRERHTRQTGRYHDLRSQAAEANATAAQERLDQFAAHDLPEIRRQLDQAAVDPDATSTCVGQILRADTALDEIAELLELPVLERDIRERIARVRELTATYGDADARRELSRLEAAVEEAIARGDREVLERLDLEITGLAQQLFRDQGLGPLVNFAGISGALDSHPSGQVQSLLSRGRAAADRGDMNTLSSINEQLRPFAPTAPTRPNGGTDGGLDWERVR